MSKIITGANSYDSILPEKRNSANLLSSANSSPLTSFSSDSFSRSIDTNQPTTFAGDNTKLSSLYGEGIPSNASDLALNVFYSIATGELSSAEAVSNLFVDPSITQFFQNTSYTPIRDYQGTPYAVPAGLDLFSDVNNKRDIEFAKELTRGKISFMKYLVAIMEQGPEGIASLIQTKLTEDLVTKGYDSSGARTLAIQIISNFAQKAPYFISELERAASQTESAMKHLDDFASLKEGRAKAYETQIKASIDGFNGAG